MSNGSNLLEGTAWNAWCDRLRDLGAELLGDEFPGDPRHRAEGFRALTRKLTYAIQQEVEAGDADFPAFIRQDLFHQWGGPNPDNIYLRADIDPAATYRVWADVSGVEQVMFSLHEGDMHLGEFGVFGECSLDELEVRDGALELWISPEDRPGNCIRSDPQARIFTIRIYQSDWENDAVPTFHIEREGNEGLPPPVFDADRMAKALDRVATWAEASMRFWNQYTSGSARKAEANRVQAASGTAGGADNIAYGNCFWDLAPDQALIVESEVPDADYWGFTIHTIGWLESGDFANRQTSLNHKQAHIDDDGRVRMVVAHHDPGVANWIDTEEHQRGMLVYRWVWARTRPTPAARVVPLASIEAEIPATHPRVAPDERRKALSRRRAAIWQRYL